MRLFQVRSTASSRLLLRFLTKILYQDEPKWIPHNRGEETEINPHRVGYLKSIGVGA